MDRLMGMLGMEVTEVTRPIKLLIVIRKLIRLIIPCELLVRILLKYGLLLLERILIS